MDWYWIVSTSHDPAWNLALEECLLDGYTTLPKEALVLLFYVNERSIIIGKHQNPWLEVRWDSLQQPDLPLYRRITGGGAVYHDQGNLNFSFIQPRLYFSKEENLSLIQEALRNLGIEVGRTNRGDLLYGNCKVSGNALCYRKDRVLHHGTLLIEADLFTLRQVFSVPPSLREMFRSPAVLSVGASTANLKDFFPFLSIPIVMEAVIQTLSAKGVPVFRVNDLEKILQEEQFQCIYHRHGTWEWVFGATPPFWFYPACAEVPKGGESPKLGKSPRGEPVSCKVEAGRITEVRGPDVNEIYVGRSFDPECFQSYLQKDIVNARRDA